MIKKKIGKVLLIVIVVILLLMGIGYYLYPYKNTVDWDKIENSLYYDVTLEKGQALEDLEYLVNTISDRHVSSVDGLPDKVSEQYKNEIQNLSENPTVLDVWRAGSRIVGKLGDAHSKVSYISDNYEMINIGVKKIDGKFLCTTKEREDEELISINKVPIHELYKKFLSQFSYENSYWAEYNFSRYLRTKRGLNWLGISVNNSVTVEFKNDGVTEIKELKFKENTPSSNNSIGVLPNFVKYKIDKYKKLGILRIDSCDFNDFYKLELERFFREVKENNIKNIAVDLRFNGGGNSRVVNEFVRYLPVDEYMDFGCKIRLKSWIYNSKVSMRKNKQYKDLLYDGDIDVLTSNGTFSSATWFSVLLRDNGLCKIIGEPSGNMPSAYGDILLFEMPHSKLAFTLTYKQFSRPDVSKHEEDVLMPDYLVESNMAIDEFYKLRSK
ncbi:hypothetical protein SH2C18_51490 [Clostridium sediminicola]|uniref:S41 family peptidase n=1 Tax=Clostridium sediminicola TaxID=3114879 RepID=UPI0031F243F1